MKKLILITFSLSLCAAQSLLAAETVTLEGVHLCCKACERGVTKAITEVEGASCSTDQDSEQVTLTAPNKKSLRKSVNAILNAGYYGTPTDKSVKAKDLSGAKNKMVESLTVTGIHLCCGQCVSNVEDALDTVEGVTGSTIEKKVDSFQVMGKFNAKEVFAALREAGVSGKVGR